MTRFTQTSACPLALGCAAILGACASVAIAGPPVAWSNIQRSVHVETFAQDGSVIEAYSFDLADTDPNGPPMALSAASLIGPLSATSNAALATTLSGVNLSGSASLSAVLARLSVTDPQSLSARARFSFLATLDVLTPTEMFLEWRADELAVIGGVGLAGLTAGFTPVSDALSPMGHDSVDGDPSSYRGVVTVGRYLYEASGEVFITPHPDALTSFALGNGYEFVAQVVPVPNVWPMAGLAAWSFGRRRRSDSSDR